MGKRKNLMSAMLVLSLSLSLCAPALAAGGEESRSVGGLYLEDGLPSGVSVEMQDAGKARVNDVWMTNVHNDGNFVNVYNGSVRMRVTVTGASAGVQYAVILVEGRVSVPTVDNSIAYIDQMPGSNAVFDVYPKDLGSAAKKLTLFIVDGDGNKITVNCGYAPRDTYTVRTYMLGDVNKDGAVNALDATWILQYTVGTRTLTDAQAQAGDVNLDRRTDALDAMYILQLAAGRIGSFAEIRQ